LFVSEGEAPESDYVNVIERGESLDTLSRKLGVHDSIWVANTYQMG